MAIKSYNRVNWAAYPSTSTPISADNLNKMDEGIDNLDDRVVSMLDTIEKAPVMADTISTTEAVPRDADTLGGRVTADTVDKLSANLNQFAFRKNPTSGKKEVSSDNGVTWENFSSGAELLWTNPAPNSDFAANKKVSIDTTPYEAFIIQSTYSTSFTYRDAFAYVYKNFDGNKLLMAAEGASRKITIADDGITFETAKNTAGQSATTQAMPYRIWGLTSALF